MQRTLSNGFGTGNVLGKSSEAETVHSEAPTRRVLRDRAENPLKEVG